MDEIHKVCRLGDLKLIREVLEKDATSINDIDPKLGWTPLYRCVICGHEQATFYLLSQGADPNLQNHIGEGPLHQAAENGSQRVVHWLLEAHADPNLRQNGKHHVDGETPLHKACVRGEASIVKLLLDYKADPDAQNATFGWTPLHYCAESGNTELWELLISRGANDSIRDWRGKSPSTVSPRGPPTISNRSTQNSALCKPSPEPLDVASSSRGNESVVLTPASSRTPSSMSGGDTKSEITKSRSRKGSPPLVPRLKLNSDKKAVHTTSPTSFDSSLGKAYSNVSKSQDLSFSFRDNYGKRATLEKWLRRVNLEMLTDVLIDSGYDDLDQLLAQAQRLPISIDQLQSVGVKRRGHAIRLLAALELELQAPERRLIREVGGKPWECCEGPDSAAGFSTFPTLQVWLKNLGLEALYPNFLAAGFEDLEPLLMVMKTSYALTEESLSTEFAIGKPGHRHRLLSKLKEDSSRFELFTSDLSHSSARIKLERVDRTASCELCTLM